jgi:hypothetical protein
MGTPAEAKIEHLLNEPLRLGRGRRAIQVRADYVRDLSVEDLLAASTMPAAGAPVVLELRQTHHNLARLIAQGAGTNEASAITGLTPARISTLKNSPAFAELVTYYKEMDEQQYSLARADMHKRLASVGFDSLEILHERLLDKPEEFDNKTLLAVVEATADRTGHGKTSTVNHDHSFSLSSHTIAAIKASANQGRPIAEEDRGALLRIAAERTAPEYPEAEEADWIEGCGSGLREEGDQEPEASVPLGEREIS